MAKRQKEGIGVRNTTTISIRFFFKVRMISSETARRRAQILLIDPDTMLPAARCSSSRRTPSFSSLSSLSSSSSTSSYFLDDYPLSPATPLRFSGVPFSWEKLPGIPKRQNSIKKKDSARNLLPLPPQGTTKSCKKLTHGEAGNRKKSKPGFQRDPFFAAFIECSKDNHNQEYDSGNLWTGAKVTRSISNRFGFVSLCSSCKNTCSVSESIVHLPRSRRTNYDLITRRLS